MDAQVDNDEQAELLRAALQFRPHSKQEQKELIDGLRMAVEGQVFRCEQTGTEFDLMELDAALCTLARGEYAYTRSAPVRLISVPVPWQYRNVPEKDAPSGAENRLPEDREFDGAAQAAVDDAAFFEASISRSLDAVDDERFAEAREQSAGAHEGLLERLREAGADHATAFDVLEQATLGAKAPEVQALQAYLDGLEGRSWGSLKANKAFSRALNETLARMGCAILCPNCEQPGRLVVKAGTSPQGAFAIHHGKTTHGGRARLPRFSVESV